MALRIGTALLVGGLSLGYPLLGTAAEIAGATQATLEWTPASGSVAGYYVIISRDAGPAQVEAISLDTRETVNGAVGETLVVQVSAFAADGIAGPVSPPSEPIRFVSSGGSGSGDPAGGGGGSDPGTEPGGDPRGPSVARDFDGDGLADLLVREGARLSIWALDGAHVAAEILLPQVPDGSDLVGVGDYDGNGTADLLWEQRSSHDLRLWLSDGGVVTRTSLLDRSSLASGEEWRVAGSEDLDGDGRDDLLLFSRIAGETEVWTFDEAGVVSRTRLAGRRGTWRPELLGGGMGALVWFDEEARVLELGPAQGTSERLGELGAGWTVVGVADLDGVDLHELLLADPESGAVQAWSIGSDGLRDVSASLGVRARGALASTGDFDGDLREDLAWSDPATGVVTLRLGSPPVEQVLDRTLPQGATVISGARGSDPYEQLRDRYCPGDFNGDGVASTADLVFLRACLRSPGMAGCEQADFDGNGVVNTHDIRDFIQRFSGATCQ